GQSTLPHTSHKLPGQAGLVSPIPQSTSAETLVSTESPSPFQSTGPSLAPNLQGMSQAASVKLKRSEVPEPIPAASSRPGYPSVFRSSRQPGVLPPTGSFWRE